AIENIVLGIPGQPVGQAVASGVNRARPGQGQVLDVVAQRVGDRGTNAVGALAGKLDHPVADIVDIIGVVALATTPRADAGPAVQNVIAAIAIKDIVPLIAIELVIALSATNGLVDRVIVDDGSNPDMRGRTVLDL